MRPSVTEMEQESDIKLRYVSSSMFNEMDTDRARTVWFQHYRKENFHDESLPPGKWTKRESKQNWVCPSVEFLRRN
jgi:hypothetical protein